MTRPKLTIAGQLPRELASLARRQPELAAPLLARFQELTELARRGEAEAWARAHHADLLAAPTAAAVLHLVVEVARNISEVPSAWALSWTGHLPSGRASVSALAGQGAELVPPPSEVSTTVLGRVATTGAPAWSNDPASDFDSASVRAQGLASLACLPIGSHAALYLSDPTDPARFGPDVRLCLEALCRLAGPVLDRPSPDRAVAPQSVSAIPEMVGDSPAMRELAEAIRAFAPVPWPALILGETGSGKELAARALHRLSAYAAGPLVVADCTVLTETLAESALFGHERGAFTGADRQHKGLVERAAGGTLFLDEVGELPLPVQAKLLRLLQEGTFERVGGERPLSFTGRVLAATNRDLHTPEGRGSFREDLYYRLASCRLEVPALHQRRADIPALAEALVQRFCGECPSLPPLTLAEDALEQLAARRWPGNVRQLGNVLREAMARAWLARSPQIGPEHLRADPDDDLPPPPGSDSHVGLRTAVDDFKRRHIEAVLAANGGNQTRAAKRLGVSRQWLSRLLAKLRDDEYDGGDDDDDDDGDEAP